MGAVGWVLAPIFSVGRWVQAPILRFAEQPLFFWTGEIGICLSATDVAVQR